jgi:UDPglucose--hexose-1-phosphate uridylyltransferase
MDFFLREDPLTGDRRIIAPVRRRRPHRTRPCPEEEPLQCPFCPGNESLTPQETLRVEGGPGWVVRVIPNKFPAVPRMHDVVVDSPSHREDLDTIPHLDKVLWVYRERMTHYYSIEGVKFVAVFRNRGREAGASIPHPHSQVVALPFYPGRFLKERERYQREGGDLLGALLSREMDLQERVLRVSRNFCALLAYAPTVPYEVWIVPKVGINSFVFERNLEELAEMLRYTVSSLKGLLGEGLSYNLTLQSAPPWERNYRYYLRILPRVSVFGGFEMETESVIVSVAPEEAARELRAVMYAKRTE